MTPDRHRVLPEQPVGPNSLAAIESRAEPTAPSNDRTSRVSVATILIVDDDKNIRARLADYVCTFGHEVETAADVAEALAILTDRDFDLVLSDVRMAGTDGLALLREVLCRQPETLVVLMTAYATVTDAVEAIRAGAFDYLVKPFSTPQLQIVIERALEVRALRRGTRTPRPALTAPLLESSSPVMQRAIETARQVATSDAAALLTGESGTGKNVLAAAIHGWSPRRDEQFVTVSCLTLREHLLESELFGHVRGAFAGVRKGTHGQPEAASSGTLFFDDVGELSPALQAKLLRFLDERRFERVGGNATIEVDARVIAATSKNLETEVAAGRFRADLFFRLNVVAINLPPLRERGEDLIKLTDHLLQRLAARHRRGTIRLAPEVRRLLALYRWPGNVRELFSVLERALVLASGDTISASDLPERLLTPAPVVSAEAPSPIFTLEEVEQRHIQLALAQCGTLEEAAARLGIDPATLWRKRKRYGLS